MANLMDYLRGTPLWVKIFGIIAIILVLLLGINFILSGGQHTSPVPHGVPQP